MAIFGLTTRREYNKLATELAALKAALPPEWALATAEAEKWNLPDPSVYENQARLYQRLSWVLAAVQAVANEVAVTPFMVKKRKPDEKEVELHNHPFELLLDRPNEEDSRYDFLYATAAMKKLNGNAYWWLNKADEFAPPDELWFILPSTIKPIPDGRLYIKGYWYYPGDGSEIFLEPWEIVHYKSFNPFSRFVGLSAIESLALVAQGDIGMQDWNTRLFKENNARLPGILTFAEMVPDTPWEDIKRRTIESSRKREMMLLRGVGRGDVNWIQNAVSQKDMEFLAGRAANRQEIWDVLAPGLESMLSPNATEANARAGRATFNDRAVWPELVAIQEKITQKLLPAYGKKLVGKFKDIRYSDRALELQEIATYSQTHTVQEVRNLYYGDMPVGDDRDKLFPVEITPAKAEQPDNRYQEKVGADAPPNPPDEPHQQTNARANGGTANKAVQDELARWKRKALKRPGAMVEFISDILPVAVMSEVKAGLSASKTADDIGAVFARVEAKDAQNGHHPQSEILLLAEKMDRLATAALNGNHATLP